MNNTDIQIIYSVETDNSQRDDVIKFLEKHWGSVNIVSKGKITDASKLPRIIARDSEGKIVGLATFEPDLKTNSCELVSIDAVIQRKGIGSNLMNRVKEAAKNIGCKKLWLITTNDNIEGAGFYIKNGFRLMAVHLNALDKSRELKPQIPKIGKNGIPLLDEWEFETSL